MNRTNKDKFNKFIELNKFLNNVCIIWVKTIRSDTPSLVRDSLFENNPG
jgi:hypothetical protein